MLASADFVAGAYSVAGVPVTAADIVDQPELVTANGLEVPFDTEFGDVAIIGDFLDVLLTANWTLLLEYEDSGGTSYALPLAISSAAPSWSEKVQILRGTPSSGGVMEASDEGSGGFRTATDTDSHGAALTRTDAKLAISVNGGAVISDTSPVFSLTLTVAAFGSLPDDWTGQAVNIRSLKIYAAMADASLPSLSHL